jgi:hypothetical protein
LVESVVAVLSAVVAVLRVPQELTTLATVALAISLQAVQVQ